jgi:hypothetical protein
MRSWRSSQSGWMVLLIVLSLLGVAVVLIISASRGKSAKLIRSEASILALAKAKEALLGYAISRDDFASGARPGEFPCPTLVAPGTSSYGDAAGGCVTRRVGRLPWKTLGIPELFDESGEPLWYALSTKFNASATYVNSSSRGDLTIYTADGVTLQQTEAVAIIFSAGSPVGSQNRSPTETAACVAASSAMIARNMCADNYLDATGGRNNASNAGPYIVAVSGSNFNDKLALILASDFIPRIEDRVAQALTKTVNAYYAKNSYYPFAAFYSDAIDPSPSNQANCAANTFSGRFPQSISYPGLQPIPPRLPCVDLQEWQNVSASDRLPEWFFANQWYLSIYYAVGKAFVNGGSKACISLGDCLSVDGDNSVQALLMLPGTPLPGQIRISSSLNDYFEVAENLEGWPTSVNYRYTATSVMLPSRDRLIPIKN